MAMSMEIQLSLYAILVVVTAFAGYYIGRMYDYPMTGAAVGVGAGVVASGLMYRFMGMDSSGFQRAGAMAY